MILREPCLPQGWYPRDRAKIEEFLSSFQSSAAARAAVAPHAGWYYSGVPAAMAVSSLDRDAETVAVIGGHLGRGRPVLVAAEDGAKTPLGIMKIDAELREKFQKQLPCQPEGGADNTVEVLLPMVHYFFPKARLLWLRFPAEISSFAAGELLAEAAAALGRRLVLVASADLTHYGPNYGFSPKGRGKAALDWVKNVNDAAFIKAVLDRNPAEVLERAEEDYSSCSAGSVLGALGFTGKSPEQGPTLLDYRTSADIGDEGPADSFVGYAAIAFG